MEGAVWRVVWGAAWGELKLRGAVGGCASDVCEAMCMGCCVEKLCGRSFGGELCGGAVS